MRKKWVDVRVSKELFNKMNEGNIEGIELVSEPTTPRMDKPKKETPYLEIIYTGKKSESSHENPEKVQFPAFCMFTFMNQTKLGVICAYPKGGKQVFELFDFSKQWGLSNRTTFCTDLNLLMEEWQIEILKVKVIVKRG